MSHYLVRQVEATPKVRVRLRTEIVGGGGDGWLEYLVLRDRAEGGEETVNAGGLFLMIGARPHTEWLPPEVDRDAQGFVLTGTDLPTNARGLGRDPGPPPPVRGRQAASERPSEGVRRCDRTVTTAPVSRPFGSGESA